VLVSDSHDPIVIAAGHFLDPADRLRRRHVAGLESLKQLLDPPDPVHGHPANLLPQLIHAHVATSMGFQPN